MDRKVDGKSAEMVTKVEVARMSHDVDNLGKIRTEVATGFYQ